MKLKVTPRDFLVEEVTDYPIADTPGPYAVYRLDKTSWDTFDLVELLSRRIGVPKDSIRVGGIKDRHGSTRQLISVEGLRIPPSRVEERNFNATLAGFAQGPISAKAVLGNRFSIVMKDMSEAQIALALRNMEAVRRCGVPNYFDEQRFGSARHGGGFMGKSIFRGRREEALKLYFLPSKHDDQKTRKLKKCVTANWGRFKECLPLGFGQYGRIVAYLAGHPRAFHRALSLIDPRFLVFAVNAYQSFLFNEILARRVASLCGEHGLEARGLRYAFGTFVFPVDAPEELMETLGDSMLPVPGYDTVETDPGVKRALAEVLRAEDIRLSDLRVRQMRRVSAHGVWRKAFVTPRNLTDPEVSRDELYPSRKKMAISFFLPRGGYATVLIKRLLLP
jgi:tRNA pseudouridine13 synthase